MTSSPPTLEQRLEEAERAAVAEVQRLTESELPNLHWWTDSDAWASHLSGIEDTVDQYVNEAIHDAVLSVAGTQSPPQDSLKAYIDLIRYRREKVPLRTGITDQILGICQQVLAFGAAGLALAIGFLDKVRAFSVPVQKVLAVGGIFYAELTALSLAVLVWYMFQAHFRYPFLYFKKIGNAGPYFYYASISPVPRRPVQFAKARFAAASSYAKDLVRFTRSSFSETEEQQLRNEFQQYFLLMAYSGYIQQFSQRLTNLFFYGFVGAVASASVMAVLIAS
jgi:hypothetical protein